MFENLAKKGIMLVLPAAAVIMLAGCKESEVKAPMPEPVDLTQTEDLFTAPIKPNPLTADPEAVVVRVNGEDITRGEIMIQLNSAMQQFAGRLPPEQLPQFQAQIYGQIKDDLITKKLLDAAVAASGIQVDPAKIDETLAQIRESIPEGQTLEGILAERGQDLEALKKDIADEMATRELVETQTADIQETTETEAKEFYDANPEQFVRPENATASHILIKFAEEDTDDAKAEKKAKLDEIRKDIIAGTITFEDAAKQYSEDPGSAAKGGQYSNIPKGRMVPEFEAAVFSQEIGEVGPIVETQYGYHIIVVNDRQEDGTVSFDEVKDQLLAYLTNQNKQKAVGDYLQMLRDNATIEEM